MIIKDPVHGNISLSEFEGRIIDTPQFQRLRGIRQLGMTYLVYPGAMHTRFEHSIGTMHLASLICERLGISGERKELVRAFALLHDVGHAAFSHESERALGERYSGHEERGRAIISGPLKDLLSEKFSASEMLSAGKGILGAITSGELGADRMDYLLRDAHHIGVSYGVVDMERILHTLRVEGNEVVLGKGGLEAAESLLVGRFMMFSTVYLHKTVRIGSAMLNRAISLSLQDGMDPSVVLNWPDAVALNEMLKTRRGGAFASALLERRLYKLAYAAEGVLGKPDKVAEELSDSCGCEVLVDLPPSFAKRGKVDVEAEG
ncbi:MAG: HD domain-containing protein, partial [Candidatus Bilamarchaeaceae archaeon]